MTIVMVLTFVSWLLYLGDGLPNFIKDIPKNLGRIGTYRSGYWIRDRIYGEKKIYSKIKHKFLFFAYLHSRFMALVCASKTRKLARRVMVGWQIKQL